MGDGDGHSGDRLDFSPGDRSPRGDFAGRTVPVPQDLDFEKYLTGALETLRSPNSRCTECGGRLTAVCPDFTVRACWFCSRHKGCLNCDMCGCEAGLLGD